MSQSQAIYEITVLKINQTSENFSKIDYISAEEGLSSCLTRNPKKSSTKAKPDLFDTAQITFDQKGPSKPKFLTEYAPSLKRSKIGSSYRQLEFACKYSNFLLDNATHVPDPKELYRLGVTALNAFELGHKAEIILLKALYNFLKNEGFPVQESWWVSVPEKHKATAESLLTASLSQLCDTPIIDECAEHLLKDISNWISKETDLRGI
tara:strand:+ start:258 stop:881 length:624 start_codon:yes stop_codon:yes gene_type:complete